MAEFDRDKFREEVKARLTTLDNSKLCAAFAVKMALLALPFLAEKVDEKGFLWYWQEEKREKYLLVTLRAAQSVFYVLLSSDPNAAYAAYAAYAADAADAADAAAYAAYAADAAVDAAAAAYAYAYAADAAAYAYAYAADAAYAAADADAAIFIDLIYQELDHLQTDIKYQIYLLKPIVLPAELMSFQQRFLSELCQFGSDFDYWADWLQNRYEGKEIDVELLEKNFLLPEEIKAQTPAEINRYLKDMRDGKLDPMTRVRAIFIGDGEAGKTSLIKALNNEEVTENGTEMTLGIDISEWPVENSELTAHFWDFGGQVIAHATHQFFLRARCVYVLVLNARSVGHDPNQQAEYWLQFVRAFGADAPVLVVGNKADLNPILIDTHRLKTDYPNVQDFFPISATEYRGKFANAFAIFKNAFNQQLRQVGRTQPYFPKNHFALIDELREKSRKNPFLKKRTFNQMCNQHDIEQDRRETLLDLLDKLGEIIHFPKLALLDEFLLNPRWLTYGVYPLLYSDILKNQCGRLTRNNVVDILEKHQPTDNQGIRLKYPKEKHELLLHVMQQFKLCYPAPDAPQDAWIVPDLLPSDQPKNLHFNNHDALRFDFDFKSFLPRHVLNMFIVEQHQDIFNNTVWQHGVHLHNKTWQTEALVRANYQDRVLSIEVTGQNIVNHFAVLHDSIVRILERMPKLKYDKNLYLDEKARIYGGRIVEEKPCANYDMLLAQQAKGQKEFVCQYGTYDLMEVLKLMPKQENSPPKTETSKLDHNTQTLLLLLISFVVVTIGVGILGITLNSWALGMSLVGIVIILFLLSIVWLLIQGKLTQKHFTNLSTLLLEKLPLLKSGNKPKGIK